MNSAFAGYMEGLRGNNIDHLTLSNETSGRTRAPSLASFLLFLSTTTSDCYLIDSTPPNLTHEQAMEAFPRIDTRMSSISGAGPADAAWNGTFSLFDLSGHLSHECPYAGAIKDRIVKRSAASP